MMASAILSIICMSAFAKDDEGHTLTALWKSYYTAINQDKPKDQERILENIKKEALSKKLAWDYYDACRQYVDVRSSANWKLYDELREAFRKEIEAFPAPVAAFYMKKGENSQEMLEFVRRNKAALESARNDEFYKRDYSVNGQLYSEVLLQYLHNDYEYALWSLFLQRQESQEFSDLVQGKYPEEAFAEYTRINWMDRDKQKDPLTTYAGKYSGKAVALMARQDLLSRYYDELRDKGTSKDYMSLRDACENFIKERDSFSGTERVIAKLCDNPDNLLETLNSKAIGYKIEDGAVEVYLRNLPSVTFQLLQNKKVTWQTELKNPAGGYYVPDTLRFSLPPMDDGRYDVHCFNGKTDRDDYYERYSVSCAVRKDASGCNVYAADYKTGKPLGKVDFVIVEDDDKEIARAAVDTSDGFAALGSGICSQLQVRNRSREFYVMYKDAQGYLHRSRGNYLYYGEEHEYTPDEKQLHARLITDRSAFNPDETVYFKALLYSGVYTLNNCPAGQKVTARLMDAQNKEISSKDLVTNEFGSVAGEFVLKRGERNGMYRLEIRQGDRILDSRSLRVDDFVLPTYELIWKHERVLYRPVDRVEFKGTLLSYSGHGLGAATVTYILRRDWEDMITGTLPLDGNGNFSIEADVPDNDDYVSYTLEIKVVDGTGETKTFSSSCDVRKKPEEPKEFFFKDLETEDGISVKAVAGNQRTWMVASLYGPGNVLLEKRLVEFAPENGEPAQTVISFPYKDSYPDAITLYLIYFQDGRNYSHTSTARRPDNRYDMPLKVTRFSDETLPGRTYTFIISGLAGSEAAATIFDKSTENISSNTWRTIRASQVPAASVSTRTVNGADHCDAGIYGPIFYRGGGRMYKSAATRTGGIMLETASPMAYNMAVSDDALVMDMVYEEAVEADEEMAMPEAAPEAGAGYVRENFANTIAWEPFLLADENGDIRLKFTNADKLSTYYVQLFAVDKEMRNDVLRRQIVVTLPVKVAVVEPLYLYRDDQYTVAATLSNSKAQDISGEVEISLYGGADYKNAPLLSTYKEKLTVPATSGLNFSHGITVPAADSLGILIKFTADNDDFGSDALFTAIPVYEPVQTLTEAHSSLLFTTDNRDQIIARLRSQFVNVPGSEATVREISIFQMLGEAIPQKIDITSDNMVCLLDSYYANYLLEKMGQGVLSAEQKDDVMKRLMACKKSDGGFSWFPEMDSSPILTAVLLEKFALMGLDVDPATVEYLDAQYFHKDKRPYWYGGISMAQYAYIRAMYASVPFSRKGIDSKEWKEFKKAFKQYLVPGKTRGLNGHILAKTFRIKTLQLLYESQEGLRLAKDWGIKLFSESRMRKSLEKDLASLVQYAQPHVSGGQYFPNAVMPWRGQMESELYAHSLLCDLLDRYGYPDIANGIRLWIMVQKETQQWDSDPGYIQALGSVLSGPQEILDTKVIALSATFSKPFEQIKAAGNGFTIQRKYFLGDKELKDGDVVHVGDRIRAEYSLWSEENRSFVVLRAPRPAGLRPVQQLSSYTWRCYRSVKAETTEYWYEVFAEEKQTVTEEFYVTQQGSFRSPVADIECLYAPHYRANDAGDGYTLLSQ